MNIQDDGGGERTKGDPGDKAGMGRLNYKGKKGYKLQWVRPSGEHPAEIQLRYNTVIIEWQYRCGEQVYTMNKKLQYKVIDHGNEMQQSIETSTFVMEQKYFEETLIFSREFRKAIT